MAQIIWAVAAIALYALISVLGVSYINPTMFQTSTAESRAVAGFESLAAGYASYLDNMQSPLPTSSWQNAIDDFITLPQPVGNMSFQFNRNTTGPAPIGDYFCLSATKGNVPLATFRGLIDAQRRLSPAPETTQQETLVITVLPVANASAGCGNAVDSQMDGAAAGAAWAVNNYSALADSHVVAATYWVRR